MPGRVATRGNVNPKLTDTVMAVINRVLGADVQRLDLRLDCRATVCRLQASDAAIRNDRPWRERLDADPEFSRYSEGSGTGPGGYYISIGDPTRPQGMDFLKDVARRFRKGPALAACVAAHPGVAGDLEVRFDLPDDAGPGALVVEFGGDLAGSPLGRCVKEAIARDMVPAEPPARVRGVVWFATLTFPLAK